MKTLIVYHSSHHGNTKKLLDAIAQEGNVTLCKASEAPADTVGYDLVGLASGIYYQKFHPSVLQWAEHSLARGQKVFLLYTYGVRRDGYADAPRKIAAAREAEVAGDFGCPGFDTFGPLKLVGGIAKGRPNEADVADAVAFYRGLLQGRGA